MPDARPSLCERCAAGDAGAWRELVDAYSGFVYAIARRHRLPEDACDDVAQSVFASLAAHIAAIEDDRALPAWLRTTATRACWQLLKRLRRERPGLDLPDADDPNLARGVDRAEEHQRLLSALRSLGERCRELLQRLYLEAGEPSYERIALDLGIPIGSIGPTRRRCLDRLARVLAEPNAPVAGPDE